MDPVDFYVEYESGMKVLAMINDHWKKDVAYIAVHFVDDVIVCMLLRIIN